MAAAAPTRKLFSTYNNKDVRARIYTVLSVYIEAGLTAEIAVANLLDASQNDNAPAESKALVDALAEIHAAKAAAPGRHISAVILQVFGKGLSAEEIALLKILPDLQGLATSRLLERLATITASLPGR